MFLSLILLKLGEIDGAKVFAWKSGGVRFWKNLMSEDFSQFSSRISKCMVVATWAFTIFKIGNNWTLWLMQIYDVIFKSTSVSFSWGKLSCNQQSNPPRKVRHFWSLSSRTNPKSDFHNQLYLACGICCWRNNECNDQDVMVNMFLMFSLCDDQGVLVNITLWPLGSYMHCATGI